MTGDRFSFDELSAYVDGELDPSEAAQIASAAVSDPALAEAIARLHALRASVAASGPDRIYIPPTTISPVRSHRNSMMLGWAVAAILLVAIILIPPLQRDEAPTLARELNPVIELHDRWLEIRTPPAALDVASHGPVESLLARTGLRLVLRERVEIGTDTEATHTRFVGERGCHLSLFETTTEIISGNLEIATESGLHLARWSSQEGRAYILVARDMDPSRFAVIAGSLHEILPESDSDGEHRLAYSLEDARQRCVS